MSRATSRRAAPSGRGGWRRARQLALLGGALGPVLFSAVVVACAALRPGYSHATQFISELGASGTVHSTLMNGLGFVPSGVLLAGFAVGLASLLARERPALPGAALVLVFGAGVAAAGVFSCDPGCPQTGGSCENQVHERIGPVAFLSAIAGSGWLGLRFRRLPAWRPLWLYSVVSSGLAAGFLALLVGSLESRQLTGVWQRGMLAVLFLWCGVVGVFGFRHADEVEAGRGAAADTRSGDRTR